MVITDTVFQDQTPGEVGLLVLFIIVSTYMFVEGRNYSNVIGLYPRVLSAVVLVCSLLLLFRNVLPEPIQEYVTESDGTLGSATEMPDDAALDGDDVTSASHSPDGNTSSGQIVLTLLIGGYLLLSYLVGMYFATPVFVLMYGLVHDLGWLWTAALTVLASAIAHVFLVVFNAPLTSGILL